jgi:Ran GTPase-activating protein (RanGAP) involved in mRNA processing and transport
MASQSAISTAGITPLSSICFICCYIYNISCSLIYFEDILKVSFEINFDGAEKDEQQINELLTRKSLRVLSVCGWSIQRIKDKIAPILLCLTQNAPTLQTLSLDHCFINNGELEQLMQPLKECSALESLMLHNNLLSIDSMATLAHIIGSLPVLRSVSLGIVVLFIAALLL